MMYGMIKAAKTVKWGAFIKKLHYFQQIMPDLLKRYQSYAIMCVHTNTGGEIVGLTSDWRKI